MPANQFNVTYLLAGIVPDDLPANLQQALETLAYLPTVDTAQQGALDLIFITADYLTKTDRLLHDHPNAHFIGIMRHSDDIGGFFEHRISTVIPPELSLDSTLALLNRSVVRANGRRWRNERPLSYQIFDDAVWMVESILKGKKCQITCLHETQDSPHYAQLLAIHPRQIDTEAQVINVEMVQGWRSQAESDPSAPVYVEQLDDLNGANVFIALRLVDVPAIDESERRLLQQVAQAVIYAVRYNNAQRRSIVLSKLRRGSEQIIGYLNTLYNAGDSSQRTRLEEKIVQIAHEAMKEDGIEDEQATWVAATRFDIESGVKDNRFSGLAQYPLHPNFESDNEPEKPQTFTRNNGHTHFIITHQRPVIIPSVEHYEVNAHSMGYVDADGKPIPINKRSLDDKRRSILGLPLKYAGERVIGALWFHFNTPRMLYPSTVADLQLFADQVSHALRVSDQIRRDQLWNEVVNKIAGIYDSFQTRPQNDADIDAVRRWHYTRIVQTLQEELGAKNVVYFPYDARKSELEVYNPIYSPELSDDLLNLIDREGVEQQHNTGEISRQSDEEDGFTTPFREKEGIRSAIVLPLRRPGDHRVSHGILYINFSNLGYTVSNGLAETLRDVVRTFIEALDRRLKSANLLKLGSRIINSNLEDTSQPDITKDDLIQRIYDSTDASFIGSIWYDDKGQAIEFVNYDGDEATIRTRGVYREGQGHSDWIRQNKKPVIIEDVDLYQKLVNGTADDEELRRIEESYPHYHTYRFSDDQPLIPVNEVSQHKRQSVVGFPVIRHQNKQDEVVGVLWLNYNYRRSFTQLELDEFRQHANYAALLYLNSRRIQRHQRTLELLSRLVEKLKPELPMRRIFRMVSREANRIVARTDNNTIDYTAHRVHFVRVERGRQPWRIRFYTADYYKPVAPGESPPSEWQDGEVVYQEIVKVMHGKERTHIAEDHYIEVDIRGEPPQTSYLGEVAASEQEPEEGYWYLPDASQSRSYMQIADKPGSQIVVPIYHHVNVPFPPTDNGNSPTTRVLIALLNIDHKDAGEITTQDAITLRALGVTLGFLLDQRYRQRVTSELSQVAQALANAIRDEPAHAKNEDNPATRKKLSRAVVEAAFNIVQVKAPPNSPLYVKLYLSPGSKLDADQWDPWLKLAHYESQHEVKPRLKAVFNSEPDRYNRITLDDQTGGEEFLSMSKRAALEKRIQYTGDRPDEYRDRKVEKELGYTVRSQVSIPIMEPDDALEHSDTGEDIIAELYHYVESHPFTLTPVGTPDNAQAGQERLPGTVIGVLTVEHASYEAFTLEDIVNLYTLAQLAGVMLTSRRDMETLQNVVSAAIDLSDITHNIEKVIEPVLEMLSPDVEKIPHYFQPVLNMLNAIFERVPDRRDAPSQASDVSAVVRKVYVHEATVINPHGALPCLVPERWLDSILRQLHRNSREALQGYDPNKLKNPQPTDHDDIYTDNSNPAERITVHLTTSADGRYAEIVLRNSGRSISPALERLVGVSYIAHKRKDRPVIAPRLNDRFSQVIDDLQKQYDKLSDSDNHEERGDTKDLLDNLIKLHSAQLPTNRGIGLVIARQVLRSYGGDLIYKGARYNPEDPTDKEQRECCGAVFRILLPLAPADKHADRDDAK